MRLHWLLLAGSFLVVARALAQSAGTPDVGPPQTSASPAQAATASPAGSAGVKPDSPCKQDVEAFCEGVQPGEGRIYRCLNEHESDLSTTCRLRLAELRSTGGECKDDIAKFCASVPHAKGMLAKCLTDHFDELSEGCKALAKGPSGGAGAATAGAAAAASSTPAPASTTPTDPAAAVKESLQKSMAALRQYQWTETTVVSLKGEEKSRTQASCVYLPDGKIQKTPLAPPPPKDEKEPRGLKGKVVENKKEEISDAAKEAVELVKQYVPPDPARIQAAKAAGKVSTTPPDATGLVRLTIKDYLKPGDSLTFEVNAASKQISSLQVATFTDKKDPVGMKVAWGTLPDGTLYPAKTQLDITSQKMTVATENSNYTKIGGTSG